MKHLLATVLTATAVTIAVPASGTVHAARVCADSNGSAPGGSVYLYWPGGNWCDVRPPQRLHLLRTPSRSACAAVGGHGWTPTNRICWDVNY